MSSGTGQTGSGVTVRRLLLGSQLRRLREAQGVTREDAGYEIRASESKIGRMELGRVSFKERDVADLLTLYGVTGATERTEVLSMVRAANATPWWHAYADVVPGWFQTYLGFEESAGTISTYEVQFVPGLLQTEEYARAVIRLGAQSAPQEEIERRVEVRMRRQRLLAAEGGPGLVTVIDEAALRRPCGGPEVMRGQLVRLLELADSPRIELQVMPLGFDGLSAETGAFSLLAFRESDLAEVVYLEQFTTALYLDRPREVAEYVDSLERLRSDSLSAEHSRELLRTLLQET
ncbi:helix-turn-helix domain-containing protein [Kitasatospora sp. NBC_01287]|uniref:helix-turn-helix domain-containing protein n=1 Tax=Kitasatospora sp. NBC_01287 TaxID=2903573 RepID=UPI0022504C67|nr:helix-turn-helix transcriptional regulator [Kitasatospora sp. NBC_01287]MCX4749681.1 helix-turn-helix domain-containing protein [Kitasatospora sp. NBC_01287]